MSIFDIQDKSGIIETTGVAQTLLEKSPKRTGFIVQNRGASPVYLNDAGEASTKGGSFVLLPNEFFPPPRYPASNFEIRILGTAGSEFTCREW